MAGSSIYSCVGHGGGNQGVEGRHTADVTYVTSVHMDCALLNH